MRVYPIYSLIMIFVVQCMLYMLWLWCWSWCLWDWDEKKLPVFLHTNRRKVTIITYESVGHYTGFHVWLIDMHFFKYVPWQHIQCRIIIDQYLPDQDIFTLHCNVQWLVMPNTIRIQFIFSEVQIIWSLDPFY